jgi:D-serine deaminase-like pyridoxal phosphate-dependent protein
MDANIAYIAGVCRGAGISWRPHIKALKTPEIALREIAARAIGVTCAKLGEAEIMASAGIRDLLIANQIVGAPKIAWLTALARRSEVIVAIDDAGNVAELARAARQPGFLIDRTAV